MKNAMETLLSHRSIRSYLAAPIPEEYLDTIIQAVQRAPNWVNAQLVSVIAIKDKERRKVFSTLCDNQPHVAQAPIFLVFCADYHRIHLVCQRAGIALDSVLEDIDPLIVGAHEVGIAVEAAVVAAESLGLGTVVIGDIRKNARKVIRELNLPKYAFPVLGLCIGYADEEPDLKPRLPRKAVYFEERYNPDLQPLIEEYDAEYTGYLQDRPLNTRVGNWSELITEFYSTPYHYQGIAGMLNEQGVFRQAGR